MELQNKIDQLVLLPRVEFCTLWAAYRYVEAVTPLFFDLSVSPDCHCATRGLLDSFLDLRLAEIPLPASENVSGIDFFVDVATKVI